MQSLSPSGHLQKQHVTPLSSRSARANASTHPRESRLLRPHNELNGYCIPDRSLEDSLTPAMIKDMIKTTPT